MILAFPASKLAFAASTDALNAFTLFLYGSESRIAKRSFFLTIEFVKAGTSFT